ncbi:MAG: DUF2867 domain-containing protein [Pseudonocardia sp.]
MHCLVIGATGFVGALLVPRLLDAGHRVRCLARDPVRLRRLPCADEVDVCPGDAADPAVARVACHGVGAVFYLLHSMDGPGFGERDHRTATVVAEAAHAAGVARIVYLGGLQPDGEASAHLRSRRAVGDVLLASGVPTAVLQAGIVVGAGSASFELIRQIAAVGPVLPMPDRAWNSVQPIGIDDVLHYLISCLDLPADVHRSFDIGGGDVLAYQELITGYAAVAGLPRPVTVPVPGSAPRLTARALQVLTRVDRHLTGPLLESMAHDLVCREDDLVGLVGPPPGGPASYADAVRRTLDMDGGARLMGTPLISEHVRDVPAPAARLWSVISGIGGDTGWYTVPGAWELRGVVDRLLGGIGARRAEPGVLTPGAALDWWRIEAVDPGRSLRLRAEMKLPGIATLELAAEPTGGTTSRYVQRVTFRPCGLAGRAYWYAQLPAHNFLFAVMARTIAARSADQPAATS